MDISPKEALLLNYLRENSRVSLTKISKETNIPVSTLFEVLKRLEAGVIIKHTALMDFSKAGYAVRAVFFIGSKNSKEMKNFLLSSKSVNSLHSLTGDYDFSAELLFRSFKELMDFREEIIKYGLKSIYQTFIVEELKREMFHL